MTSCDVCYTIIHCSFRDSVSLTYSVNGTVSPLTNCFLSLTGIWTMGFGRRRYGRLLLAIAGRLVKASLVLSLGVWRLPIQCRCPSKLWIRHLLFYSVVLFYDERFVTSDLEGQHACKDGWYGISSRAISLNVCFSLKIACDGHIHLAYDNCRRLPMTGLFQEIGLTKLNVETLQVALVLSCGPTATEIMRYLRQWSTAQLGTFLLSRLI